MAGTGATAAAYKHNAFGERVSRVEGSAVTHFHYDQNGTLIAESDGTGTLIREYIWLGAKPLGLVVGPAGSPTLHFVHADHLDRVQKITDAAQALVWDGQFTPYGRTHAITGTVQNPLRFPGQWADPAAGYFYNYMRDYDATLARYLSVDPLGMDGGRNKFTYAGANPQNLIDAWGEQNARTTSSFSTAARIEARYNISYSVRNPNYYSGMRVLSQIREYNANFSTLQPPPEQWTGRDVANLSAVLQGYQSRTSSYACLMGGNLQFAGNAQTPIGSLRSPLNLRRPLNEPTVIEGLQYTGHALDRMQSRGIMPL